MADELIRRAVDVLRQLQVVSEVPARTYNPTSSSHTAEEDRTLLKFTAGGELAPSEPSEFLFHRQRINESRTRDDLEVAVIGAEEGLRMARHRSLGTGERMDPKESRDEVVAWSEAGLTAAEIAYKGDYPVRWVRHVIRQGSKG